VQDGFHKKEAILHENDQSTKEQSSGPAGLHAGAHCPNTPAAKDGLTDTNATANQNQHNQNLS
jgi:hypothetical protein